MVASKPDTSKGFRPPLRITDDLSGPSLQCIRLDGKLDEGVLSPALHQVLLGMARLRNVVSSLRIEGERVELDQARRVLDAQRPETAQDRGVLQLAQAYGDLARGKRPDLSTEGICLAHRRLFEGVLDQEIVGALKAKPNVLVDGVTGKEHFLPTPPERTAAELRALFEWFADARHAYPAPVVAAVFFAEFQGIHPFVDGNGRLGRYLNLAVLHQLGLVNAPLVPFDTRLFRSRTKYYEMLATTNSGETYTLWTRYFVKQLEAAYRLAVGRADLRELLDRFSRGPTRAMLSWVLQSDGGWFGHGDYPNPQDFSPSSISNALRELTEAGVLESEGDRKGRRYRLRTEFLTSIYNREI